MDLRAVLAAVERGVCEIDHYAAALAEEAGQLDGVDTETGETLREIAYDLCIATPWRSRLRRARLAP